MMNEELDAFDVVFKEKPDELAHIGVIRKSGRYPWGSGDTPHQRNKQLLDYVDNLKKQGLTESQIAKGMDISTTELRALKTIAKTQQKQANMGTANALKEKNMSNTAIGEVMGLNESSVRALLNPLLANRVDELESTANMLKKELETPVLRS